MEPSSRGVRRMSAGRRRWTYRTIGVSHKLAAIQAKAHGRVVHPIYFALRDWHRREPFGWRHLTAPLAIGFEFAHGLMMAGQPLRFFHNARHDSRMMRACLSCVPARRFKKSEREMRDSLGSDHDPVARFIFGHGATADQCETS